MAAMQRALEQARAGHGQIVAAVGEAGTGKSRLLYEFKATMPDECKVLEAYSVSHGKASAWLPVLELLRDYFGIEDADDPATRREKVRTACRARPGTRRYAALPVQLARYRESPDPLAQMDAQIKRRRTLDAIKRIILRESLKQPLVVIFEDLHWIDAQTQALLDLLADSIASARVLMLVNYRPEYRHEWGNKSYYYPASARPAGAAKAPTEMLAALLGDAVELKPLKRLIIERTEGNPFFIEEMVQALFDEGALVRNGAVKVTRRFRNCGCRRRCKAYWPRASTGSRREQKELLQTLAVIGRESPLGLIQPSDSQAGARTGADAGGFAGGRVHLRAAGRSATPSTSSSTR